MISPDDDFYDISKDGVITRKDGVPMPQQISMKEMIDEIIKADFLIKKDGTKPTAEEIFNYSSTGELYMVFAWYYEAVKILTKIQLIMEKYK